MNKIKNLAVAGGMAFALSAGSAQAVTVTVGGDVAGVSPANDFGGELSTAFSGSVDFLTSATITITERVRLTFTAVAAESGDNNTFSVTGLGSLFETGNFGGGTDFLTAGAGSLVGDFDAFEILDLAFSGTAGSFALGSYAVGAFVAAGATAVDTFFLAFDDNGDDPSDDDNHDDFIIRVNVTPVPVPAGVLLLGGGLLGLASLGATRKRRQIA